MIPRAFRIFDFRSIVDTGECTLSGDGITALGGQNEAGKTAILMALRDFDLEVGKPPVTQDYLPEGKLDAEPRVSVLFQMEAGEIEEVLREENKTIPDEVLQLIRETGRLLITRNLRAAKFTLEDKLTKLWPLTPEITDNPASENESSLTETADQNPIEIPQSVSIPRVLSPEDFAALLRSEWPAFVYFDSFQDMLPREVEIEELLPNQIPVDETVQPVPPTTPQKRNFPVTVQDFITLSGLDMERVISLVKDDKALRNYLENCSASITGDFLKYWKQTTDGEETVNLLVRHMRGPTGKLKLQFYVHDHTDQYPEQRSKGFLWFLSFYLRMAAWDKRDNDYNRLVLIDEPGSYLHAKAQRDVLSVLESRATQQNQTFIYTTHSPYLLPASTIHRYRVVVKNGSQGTLTLDRLTHPLLKGEQFADTLTPFLTSLGFDISDVLPVVGENNLVVEGITDYMYIHCWISMFSPELTNQLHVFPASSATTMEPLVSLLIGWGLPFVVLLDRDEIGSDVKKKLEQRFLLNATQLMQPDDAVAIEDLFARDDFKALLNELDQRYDLKDGENPSKAIKRQKIDKVILARRYVELTKMDGIKLSKASKDKIKNLLAGIKERIGIKPDYIID